MRDDLWGSAAYELVAERITAIHDEVVRRLAPRPGERWLDVATGTGEVAIRAALAGSEVVAIDLSPEMVRKAQENAARRGAAVRFDLGDAQTLPYDDAAFDVVSSCFGVVFARDAAAAARELARVCRRGGRLGVAVWRPHPGLAAVCEPFAEPGEHPPDAWAGEPELRRLLERGFDVEISEGTWTFEAASGEEAWQWWTTAVPPCRALAESLEPERREELRRRFVAELEGANGRVRHERNYLIALGRRR